ncbi:MAG: hypothetical protein IJU41_03660 [Clostridia bacterium]|nr:hypothetical protein [Clostridia bacterium]
MIQISITFRGCDCASTDFSVFTERSVDTVTAKFNFDAAWDGFTKTAIFAAGNTVKQVLLDESNTCIIPWEVLTEKGTLEVGVVGTDGDKVLPSVKVPVHIAEGIYTEGTKPSDPTPSVYEQLLNLANETQAVAQSVRDDADAGKFDGAQGEKGDKGDKGDPGADGHTPVKGVDYWTHSDKAEIVSDTERAIVADAQLVRLRYRIVHQGAGTVYIEQDEDGNPLDLINAYIIVKCGDAYDSLSIAGHLFFDNDDTKRLQMIMQGAQLDYMGDFGIRKLGPGIWESFYDHFRAPVSSNTRYVASDRHSMPVTSDQLFSANAVTKIAVSKNGGLPIGTEIIVYGIQRTGVM